MSNDLEIQLTADGHVAASEEKGREDTLIQVSLCLADQIWWPFNLLVWNPLPTAVIFVISNSSFVVTSYMLYWLNSILTSPGLFALFCLTLYLLLWIISFSLSYPGQLGFVIRDIESNFGQMMKRRLMFCSETIRELLDLVTHDSVQSSSLRIEYLHAYPEFQHSRQHILQPFYQALHWLNDQSPLEYPLNENTKTSTRIMEQLENELMNLDPFLNELHHAAAVSASCFEMKWKELFSLSDQRSTTTIYLAIQNIKSQLDAMEQQVIPFLVHGEQHMQPTREVSNTIFSCDEFLTEAHTSEMAQQAGESLEAILSKETIRYRSNCEFKLDTSGFMCSLCKLFVDQKRTQFVLIILFCRMAGKCGSKTKVTKLTVYSFLLKINLVI